MASMIVDGTEYTGTYIFNSINLAEKKATRQEAGIILCCSISRGG